MSAWDETRMRYVRRLHWSQDTADIVAGLLVLFGILGMLALAIMEVALVVSL